MRSKIQTVFEKEQLEIGQTIIPEIKIDIHSRDQVPQTLLGLQHIYNEKRTIRQILEIIECEITTKRNISSDKGRNGMDYWRIFVSGMLRTNNNWDFDHLEDQMNSHQKIREMLGLSFWDEGVQFKRRTLINNLSYISDEAYEKINHLIIDSGHKFLNVDDKELKTRVDSFVMEANIHHPTDSNLLLDAIRKVFHVIIEIGGVTGGTILPNLDQNFQEIRASFNRIRKMRRSNSKNEKVKKERDEAIQKAHISFLELVWNLSNRVKTIFALLPERFLNEQYIVDKVGELSSFLDYADYQIDLIFRRVLLGETIPQHEKIYSFFEYYTQWISKGKAKAPVELGLRVAIMDDQFGFVLKSQVMYQSIEQQLDTLKDISTITRKQITDEKITVSFLKEALKDFPNIQSVSFDKGFHSVPNQKELKNLEPKIILPKKGKLSKEDQQNQSTSEFVAGRKRHSGVESSIHALENHGLDVCRDRGLDAFKRYVGCAVAARNLQVLGRHIQKYKTDPESFVEAA